jgi:hypothetical protein
MWSTILSLCSHFLYVQQEMFLSSYHLSFSVLYPVMLIYNLAKTFISGDSLLWDTLKCFSCLWISRLCCFVWKLGSCASTVFYPSVTFVGVQTCFFFLFLHSLLLREIHSPVQTQRMDSETPGVQWKRGFNGNLKEQVPEEQRDPRSGYNKHYIF